MTTAFFAPPSAVRDGRLVLPADEARHATRALRHERGDEILVVDGEGLRHRVRLERIGDEKAMGIILETEEEVGEPSYELTVGLGLLKKRSRFETFLEKAVELGVSRIVPLRTRYAEKQSLRTDRSQRILRAALKQCGRSRLPRLAPPTALDELVETISSSGLDRAFIAHRRASSDERSLVEALARGPAPQRLLVLVGPEGGFAEEEVDSVEQAGAEVVSLGPRRLRAETAALATAAAAMCALDR